MAAHGTRARLHVCYAGPPRFPRVEGVVRDKSATHGRAARKKSGDVPGQARLVDSEIGHHAVSHPDPRTGVPAQIREHHSQIN